MVMSTWLSPLVLATSALAPVAPVIEGEVPHNPGTSEVVVCEYVAAYPNGWVYRNQQFRFEDPATKLYGGTRVWANRQTAINRNYNMTVRELSGSGAAGSWQVNS